MHEDAFLQAGCLSPYYPSEGNLTTGGEHPPGRPTDKTGSFGSLKVWYVCSIFGEGPCGMTQRYDWYDWYDWYVGIGNII